MQPKQSIYGLNSKMYKLEQHQSFKPRVFRLNDNPTKRQLEFPKKGDSYFESEQEIGKKHYSPPSKHSAIHSIIFNEDYEKVMAERSEQKQRVRDLNHFHAKKKVDLERNNSTQIKEQIIYPNDWGKLQEEEIRKVERDKGAFYGNLQTYGQPSKNRKPNREQSKALVNLTNPQAYKDHVSELFKNDREMQIPAQPLNKRNYYIYGDSFRSKSGERHDKSNIQQQNRSNIDERLQRLYNYNTQVQYGKSGDGYLMDRNWSGEDGSKREDNKNGMPGLTRDRKQNPEIDGPGRSAKKPQNDNSNAKTSKYSQLVQKSPLYRQNSMQDVLNPYQSNGPASFIHQTARNTEESSQTEFDKLYPGHALNKVARRFVPGNLNSLF